MSIVGGSCSLVAFAAAWLKMDEKGVAMLDLRRVRAMVESRKEVWWYMMRELRRQDCWRDHKITYRTSNMRRRAKESSRSPFWWYSRGRSVQSVSIDDIGRFQAHRTDRTRPCSEGRNTYKLCSIPCLIPTLDL